MTSFFRTSPIFRSRVIACLVVALVAFLTYQKFLHNYFTGSDSLALIQSGRIRTVADLVSIFTQRMMSGTTFEGVFYRPVSVLSYQLDYLVWGLNPFGFHLSDLFLHVLVTVMVFLLGMRLTKGMLRTSLLATLLFTSHPLLVETVPAIARRQDVLEALFLVLAFLFHLRGFGTSMKGNRVLSWAFFILALGTKETAVQLPGLVFLHALVFPAGIAKGVKRHWKNAFRATAPYLLIFFAYLAWRWHVLGGLGEDQSDLSPIWITVHYFSGLFYPQNFLALHRGGQAVGIFLVLVPVFIAVAVMFGRFLMAERDTRGLELYILLVVWILLPLPILVVTGSFAYRSLYSTIIPFSLLLSLVLARGWGQIRATKDLDHTVWRKVLAREYATVGLLVAVGLLVVSLAAFTPLIQDYPQWGQSGVLTHRVLTLLRENMARFPRHAVLNIEGLPMVNSPVSILADPGTHSVSYLRDYSIQSWLALQEDDEDLQVVAGHPHAVPSEPGDLDLRITRISPAEVDLTIVWDQP